MGVYLRTKFQASNIVLTSFRQGKGGGKRTPKKRTAKRNSKNPPRLGLKYVFGIFFK